MRVPQILAVLMGVALLWELEQGLRTVVPQQGLTVSIGVSLLTSVVATLALPAVFCKLVRADELDSRLHTQVTQWWRSASHSVPDIHLWPTGCRMINAAVVGLIPMGRKLLLTDALVQRLEEAELKMVVLHELAHCMRWHSWIRLLPSIVTMSLLVLAMNYLQGIGLTLVCGGLFALFVISLRAICQWTEYDADRFSIRLAVGLQNEEADNDAAQAHVRNLGQAIRKMVGRDRLQHTSWFHPSAAQRLTAISA